MMTAAGTLVTQVIFKTLPIWQLVMTHIGGHAQTLLLSNQNGDKKIMTHLAFSQLSPPQHHE